MKQKRMGDTLMTTRQMLYERCFLYELEDLFYYSRVLGNGKQRLENKALPGCTRDDVLEAREQCKDWIDVKLLGRFNNAIFKEPVKISVTLNKEIDANYFQVEGETYKLIMCLDTSNNDFSVFLRSLIKD